jgi:hypothetical protein
MSILDIITYILFGILFGFGTDKLGIKDYSLNFWVCAILYAIITGFIMHYVKFKDLEYHEENHTEE